MIFTLMFYLVLILFIIYKSLELPSHQDFGDNP